jgi:hypothetical protein
MEIRRFARIALGSAYELDTLLVIAGKLGIEPPEMQPTPTPHSHYGKLAGSFDSRFTVPFNASSTDT